MHKTIRVQNLDQAVDARVLGRLFVPYGIVYGATLEIDHDTGQSTGVGFVEMDPGKEGESAVAALDGRVHFGHILTVCWDKPARGADTSTQEMFSPMNMPDTIVPSDARRQQRGLRPENARSDKFETP